MASTDDTPTTTTAAATESAVTTDSTAAPAVKKSAAKKTAAKKTAAKKTTAKKTAARKTAAKKTSATKATAKKAAAKTAAPAEGSDGATTQVPATKTAARKSSTATGPAKASEAAAEPSFGLLFKAPEPVMAGARPPRRATSAAGSPQAADADQQPKSETRQAATAQKSSAAQESSAAPKGSGSSDDDSGSTSGGSDDSGSGSSRRSRRRGGRGRRGRGNDDQNTSERTSDEHGSPDQRSESDDASDDSDSSQAAGDSNQDQSASSRRRRRRRRRGGSSTEGNDPPGTTTRVRESHRARDKVTGVRGSTRLEAKKQRRREGRAAGRRRTIITEAEFLARRESVERTMLVRENDGHTQIGVLEDGVLVEHYISREVNASMVGNVYLGRVQNVLPSMEAAFVDIGKGRNAVLYAGEVNWDAAGLEGNVPKRIENALSSGDQVLVQVTKDPIGHKGARLTSQVSLPGRYLVYVPDATMTGISRKLPDIERARLKAILKKIMPSNAGVIVRTAAEGASEDELRLDIDRLTRIWDKIASKGESARKKKGNAPVLLHGEADLTVRVIRDVFNEDFVSLVVAGDEAWSDVKEYIDDVAPDLSERVTKWTGEQDLFTHHRVDEQIAKAMDRKVWLPSGGTLVIDRTEAMTVVDVNTGKFVGSGGNLEETVTKNNLEAAEEIVRQLRLRDIGGIIVIDFIDMVLESNRDLVVRRLLECLGRDRTKHQVAEVTSLGLVQMTRKRVSSGLIDVFSEQCEHCGGRGIIVHVDPVQQSSGQGGRGSTQSGRSRQAASPDTSSAGPTAAQIAAAAHAAAVKRIAGETLEDDVAELASNQDEPNGVVREIDLEELPTDSSDDSGASADTPDSPPEEGSESAPAPAPRSRRHRGRVVAPAGPPSSTASIMVVDPPATASSGAESSDASGDGSDDDH